MHRFRWVVGAWVALVQFCGTAAFAQTPAWWGTPEGPHLGIFAPNQLSDNWAIVNVGQLKHVATLAKQHLDAELHLTASDWEAAFSNQNPFPFAPGPSAENFAVANIGQLKFLARGFYRLLAERIPEYDSRARLLSIGLTDSDLSYRSGTIFPWSEQVVAGENKAPALIGQIKSVFSFDLSAIAKPSAFIIVESGDLLGHLLQAGFYSEPLVVRVFDAGGRPLANVPVVFEMTIGTLRLALTTVGNGSPSLTATTDATGRARLFIYNSGTYSPQNTVRITSAVWASDFTRMLPLRWTDSSAPSSPGPVALLSATGTSVAISWAPATDDFAVADYLVFKNGVLIGTTAGLSFSDGAASGTANYEIRARDVVGNISEPSMALSATALSGRVAAPTGLTVTAEDVNAVSLSWAPALSNEPIRCYQILINGSVVATVVGTKWIVRGLNCGSTYSFAVRAILADLTEGAQCSEVSHVTGSANGLHVAAHASHVLFYTANGTVYGCGANAAGELPFWDHFDLRDGASTERPVQLSFLPPSQRIAAGWHSNLFLSSTGVIKFSGMGYFNNGFAQASASLPIAVPELSGMTFTGIAESSSMSSSAHFAIKSGNGVIYGWGNNAYGQLGRSTGSSADMQPQPVRLSDGGEFGLAIQVAAGAKHAAAIRDDFAVWSWGYSPLVGDDAVAKSATASPNISPVVVRKYIHQETAPYYRVEILYAHEIACGDNFTIARDTGGKVYAWGNNNYWQSGIRAYTDQEYFSPLGYPIQTDQGAPLLNIISVAAGANHGLALSGSGAVWAWGSNSYGQLGNDADVDWQFRPRRVWARQVQGLPAGIQWIAAAANFSIAGDSLGKVWAWGENQNGMLGTGQASGSVPKRVWFKSNGITFSTFALEPNFAKKFVYLAAPELDYSIRYTLDGSSPTPSSPQAFPSLPIEITTPSLITAQAFAGDIAVSDLFRKYILVGPSGKAKGRQAAMMRNGKFFLWGSDDLYDSPGLPRFPVEMEGLDSTRVVGLGTLHRVGGDTQGILSAWGANSAGQLGSGTLDRRVKPTTVSGIQGKRFTAVGAARAHTLAVTDAGQVWSWGSNVDGQLGSTASQVSQTLPLLPTLIPPALQGRVMSLNAGPSFSFALTTTNSLWAWGFPYWIAPIADMRRQFTPSQIYLDRGVRQIAFRDVMDVSSGSEDHYNPEFSHTVVLRGDGTVWAWGVNDYGQLGNGTKADNVDFGDFAVSPIQWPAGISLSPARVEQAENVDLTNVVALAAGGAHNLALKADGTVWSWGKNNRGQLGYATQDPWRTRAAQVPGISGITWVAAGYDFSMAGNANGDVWAWGDNTYSQLGDGTTTTRTTPAAVNFSSQTDSNSDGIPDLWATHYGIANASDNPDNDNLTNLEEYLAATDPNSPDTDDDGLKDGDELKVFGTNPLVRDAFLAKGDMNHDGLPDGYGIQLGISPYDNDADGDNLSNEAELLLRTDPLRADTDGDGYNDLIDAFPLDPTAHAAPQIDTSPNVAPTISIDSPKSSIVPQP